MATTPRRPGAARRAPQANRAEGKSVELTKGQHMNALEDIATERRRQVEAEGYDLAHDDEHTLGQLAGAAALYAEGAHSQAIIGTPGAALYGLRWPWKGEPNWKGPRENLVRAGALIIAEIERIDRKSIRK